MKNAFKTQILRGGKVIIRFIDSKTHDIKGVYECLDTFLLPRVGEVIKTMLNENFMYTVVAIEHNVSTFNSPTGGQIVTKNIDIHVKDFESEEE